MKKVTIVGAGEVGATSAFCIAERDIINELVLIDSKPGLAEGKALDLMQMASMKRFDTRIRGASNDFAITADSDIIVITSGIVRGPGMERNDLTRTNVKIVQEVTQSLAHYSPNAIIIVVSNPLDILCYCTYVTSQFPAHRVMGMSGLLDIARYKSFIAEELNVSSKDIQALILGGHGRTMVPMPRYTTIGGIPIRQLMSEEQIQKVIRRTQLGGEELINFLGRSAWFAAGASICKMVEAVICDQRRVFPVCAYLDGEYGISDIYLGVPVILGARGVEKIIELELDPDDKVNFEQSEQEIRNSLNIVKKNLL